MKMLIKFLLLISVLVVLTSEVKCEEDTSSIGKGLFSNAFIEEGRTFVHHTIKRLAVILPAIFFKLGIAFTLLLLVTVVAVNNGFIGFLLLVVGMSTVLARLQDARRPVPVPLSLPAPLPALHALPAIPHYVKYGHQYGHHHFLDRSDDGSVDTQEAKTAAYSTATNPSYQNYVTQISNPYGYSSGSIGSAYSNKYYSTAS